MTKTRTKYDNEQRNRVSSLSTEYLTCRTFGHAWSVDVDREGSGSMLHLTCVRCKAQRFAEVDGDGDVTRRRYRYPESYHIEGRVSRSVYRWTFVRQAP